MIIWYWLSKPFVLNEAKIRYIAHFASKVKCALLFRIIDQVYAHYVSSSCQGMASLNT